MPVVRSHAEFVSGGLAAAAADEVTVCTDGIWRPSESPELPQERAFRPYSTHF